MKHIWQHQIHSMWIVVLVILPVVLCGGCRLATRSHPHHTIPPSVGSEHAAVLPPAVLRAPVSRATVDRLAEVGRWGEGRTRELVYHPTGQFIALATTLGVMLYATPSFEQLAFIETEAFVHSLALSADGSLLAFALSGQNTVYLYEVPTGNLHTTLSGSDAFIQQVAFSPVGNILAVSTLYTVTLWHIRDGTLQRTLTYRADDSLGDITFSPDGSALAAIAVRSQGQAFDIILVWHTNDGTLQHTLTAPEGTWLDAGRFSPDGTLFAAVAAEEPWGASAHMLLWHIAVPHTSYELVGPTAIASDNWAFSPDGQLLAAGTAGGAVMVWQVDDGIAHLTLHSISDQPVTHVAFSPDGTSLVAGQSNGTAHVWRLADGALQQTFSDHAATLHSMALSPDGQHLATMAASGMVHLLSLADGRVVFTLERHTMLAVHSVAFAPDGGRLAVAVAAGQVWVWPLDHADTAQILDGHHGSVDSVAFSPDGTRLASGVSERVGAQAFDDTVRLWNLADGALLHQLGGEQETVPGCTAFRNNVVFSPDGTRLAAGSHDFTVHIWNTARGTRADILAGHTDAVLAVAFSPDGSRLASASQDGTVRIWRDNGQLQQSLGEHAGGATAVRFSPDGAQLVTGTALGDVTLWDAATGLQVRTFAGASHRRSNLAFSPDGTLLAAGTPDHAIRVWDVSSGEVVAELTGHTNLVQSIAFAPDGSLLASGSVDGTVRLWGVMP